MDRFESLARCVRLQAPGWESAADELIAAALGPAGEERPRQALAAIFSGVVEYLSDAFEQDGWRTYVAFFSRVIQACRQAPGGGELDTLLHRFGIADARDLVQRYERIRRPRPIPHEPGAPLPPVALLSRVTIGADVAITSLIARGIHVAAPGTPLHVLGSPKLSELLDGRFVRVEPLSYPRRGGLLDRLAVWPLVVRRLQALQERYPGRPLLVLDTDSRLTQLGLLPVVADERYRLFESRCYRRPGRESLAELAAEWIGELLGHGERPLPWVALSAEDRRLGSAIRTGWGDSETRPLVCLNLGVGGNEAKRIPGGFERALLLSLLERGCRVLLDRGAGAQEEERIGGLLGAARSAGYRCHELVQGTGPVTIPRPLDLLCWRGSIGGLAALSAGADLYLGYDSAGQHIAAALGTPTINVFTGFTSPMMPRRWRATGPAETRTLVVDPRPGPAEEQWRPVLQRCLRAVEELLGGTARSA